MSIDPIEPLSPVHVPDVVDGPWWTTTRVARMQATNVPVTPLERDPRAEALGIAQHATAFIPVPIVPDASAWRRRLPRR